MDTVDVLRRAKEEIVDPERWYQGGYGTPERKCLGGALNVALGRDHTDCPYETYDTDPAIQAVVAQLGGEYVADFNDSHTHAEVIAALDRAIFSLADQDKRDRETAAAEAVAPVADAALAVVGE